MKTVKQVKAVVCDFDGTFSTLRCGWEAVMKRMMMKYLPDEAWIDAFIGETTGVQTILQMKGFLEELKRRGGSQFIATVAGTINCAPPDDPWFYKNEYNDMLMASVAVKRDEVVAGKVPAATYHVPGALLFLQALKTRGVKIYFASGTDQADVRAEAAALGFAGFAESIAGALPKSESCAKEAALKRLVEQAGVAPEELAVVGDGKVEIALGKALGARTLGVATIEEPSRSRGSATLPALNLAKKARLEKAGADMIVGDFRDLRPILDFLGLGANPPFAFAEHKGYGFATMVEAMTGVLAMSGMMSGVNSWNMQPGRDADTGHCFIVVNPAFFGGKDALRERIDAMIDELKRCPTVEGANEVLYPGELEWRREAAARAEGVELPVASEKELARAAEMTGVRNA